MSLVLKFTSSVLISNLRNIFSAQNWIFKPVDDKTKTA